MIERLKQTLKKIFSFRSLLNSIRSAFSKKNLIRHFVDAVVATLILFTVFGESLVGRNLPPIYLIVVLAIYLTYALYKWFSHIQDLYEQEKKKYKH